MNKKIIALALLASSAYLCGSSNRGRLPSSPLGLVEPGPGPISRVINKDVPFFIKDRFHEIGLKSTFDSDVLLRVICNLCPEWETALVDNKVKVSFIPIYRSDLPSRPKGAGSLACSFGDSVSLEGFLRSFKVEDLWYFSVNLEDGKRPL